VSNATRSKKQSRWRPRAVKVLAVIAASTAIFYTLRPVPTLVDLQPASVGSMYMSVEEDGITRIRERYVVSTPLDGRMQRLGFDVGDSIPEGTTLVRMEPTDPELLDPRAIAQAKARVKAAEGKVASAVAAIEKANVNAHQAELDMSRARLLRETAAISESEFELSELNYQLKQQEAKQAGFALDIAKYELELEKSALLLTAPETSSSQADDSPMELAIKSPIRGRLLKIYQESSAVLKAGASLVEIGDPTDLEIVVDVLSRDAVKIHSGDAVIISNWGGDAPLTGRVRLIEPSGFTKISALGVEEQRVNVIVDFVDPPEYRAALGDNFRVDCKIIIWKSDSVLTVPSSALFRVEKQWYLFTVRKNLATRTPVNIGHDNGILAELTSGINDGDVVILYPSDSLADGTRVARR
jgi:HlyD family secretion protein